MAESETIIESGASFRLEYRLTEDDVRHYATSGKLRACRRLCRDQGAGLIPLLAVGLLLLALFYRSHGARSVGLMLGTMLAVLAALGWLRWDRHSRKECRLARAVGLPIDVRLAVEPAGITKDESADGSDPGRTFAWSEVVGVGRVDRLTVIRLRPAGGVLLIPDRAFPDGPARADFETQVPAPGRCGQPTGRLSGQNRPAIASELVTWTSSAAHRNDEWGHGGTVGSTCR